METENCIKRFLSDSNRVLNQNNELIKIPIMHSEQNKSINLALWIPINRGNNLILRLTAMTLLTNRIHCSLLVSLVVFIVCYVGLYSADDVIKTARPAHTIIKQTEMTSNPIPVTENSPNKMASMTESEIAEKEKEETFYQYYNDVVLEEVSFEGTVKVTSRIPDPKTNDYENCLYAIFVEVDSVLSNTPSSDNVPYEVVINVPIMKDKTILEGNRFIPGNKISCLCVDYVAMPRSIQEMQISDDIQSFEHQQYYATRIKKVAEFQTTGKKNFAKREITVFPIQSLPKEEKATTLRQERIQKELAHIESELKKHGGSFEEWKKEYNAISNNFDKLRKNEYKQWINDSFFAADEKETSYKTKEYIDSILPYKRYLEENNIDLIVLRIPGKGDFAARVLASDVFQENPAWIEHYYECMKNDIEIVDPMRLMWNHRFDLPLFYYFNDPKERHPFEGAYYYSAIAISNVLKRYEYEKAQKELSLLRVKQKTNRPRFLYPDGNDKYPSSEFVQFNQVLFDEKPLVDLSQNSGSPFLFLGNCFFGRYIIKELALPLYAAYQLQTIPDFVYREGVTTGLIRHFFSSPGLLTNRKAVILIGMPDTWKACSSFPRYLQHDKVTISLEETIPFDSKRIMIQNAALPMPKFERLIAFSYLPDIDCYFKKRKDGGFWIEPNWCSSITFLLSIPHLQDKSTCMLRFKWLKTGRSLPTINIYKADDNSTIEYGSQPGKGVNTFCDCFIPLTGSDETTIKIHLVIGGRDHVLDNIELWYY